MNLIHILRSMKKHLVLGEPEKTEMREHLSVFVSSGTPLPPKGRVYLYSKDIIQSKKITKL
jgi:hypothetical protein